MKKVSVIVGVLIALFGCFLVLRYLIDSFSEKDYVLSENTNFPSIEAINHFSGGLKIKTISNPDYNQTDFSKFTDFIKYHLLCRH